VFDYQMTELSKFLEDEHHAVKFGDVMAHSKRLAELVVQAQGRQYRVPKPWPTMRLLLAALSEAQAFVHFATYGISHQLLGALKLTSMRVPVCGWASMVDSNTRAEMDEYPTETPKFKAKAIASKHWLDAVPHQKLVIIDGLLAFTGSANLTNTGLRHVDRAFDIGAVVTDLDQVRRLNDSYFSNVWATISDRSATENIYISEPF
jgi:phosphatidylserine/phosphatidylglycerophosphate/cardiolipin synthase-like enzyme